MIEKRKHRRADLIYNLEAYDLDTEKCLGHLVDISLGGFKILSECQIVTGKEYNFRICLPEENPKQSFFTIKVKCCWSTTDINPDSFASGFCFIALSLENIKLIKMLIHRYELENNTASISY